MYLVMDLGRPWECRVDGHLVKLRPVEWRLLKALARQPRKLLSWEDAYTAIWPDEVRGEPAQIYSHASRIRSKVRTALEGEELPLVTRPTHGLVLEIDPEAVEISGGLTPMPRRKPMSRPKQHSPARNYGKKTY